MSHLAHGRKLNFAAGPSALPIEVSEILKRWNIETLKHSIVELLKQWKLKHWNNESWNIHWNVEMLKSWDVETLKRWNVEMLKRRNVETLKR